MARAMTCFTPEGERMWVPGWEPAYATGQASESPGTVFTTVVDGVETIWVIIGIDRVAGRAAYARITPGHHAGTVRVRCSEAPSGRTVARVDYDMSPLSEDPGVLDHFAQPEFGRMLRGWSVLIAEMIARQSA